MGLKREKRGERTSQTLRKEEIKGEATANGGGGAIYGSHCPITMQRERERAREREREGVLIWVLGI